MKKLIPLVIIAVVIIGGAIIYTNQKNLPETLSPQKAAEKAIGFINQNMLQGEITASLIDVTESNGLYKMKFKVEEEEIESYVSLDGQLLFFQPIDMGEISSPAQEESQSQEIPETDIPDVKLFVMSYCPYGLQAQKALLPAYNLLRDKAEIGVYFVNYIMHEKKEIDENLRQYCIQAGQRDKYLAYATCFVKDGDYEKCLSEAGIDKNSLDSCITQTDQEYKITEKYNDKSTWLNERYPLFDVHTGLNQQYGVGGSPTIVINDAVIVTDKRSCPDESIDCLVLADFTRSPEEFKKAICQAFNTPPEECSQTLSTDVASPGLGGGTGGSSGGSCE